MPDVSVGNTPVSVVLENDEIFSPSAGNTVRVEVTATEGASADINGPSRGASNLTSGSANSASNTATVVLTDDKEVKAAGDSVFVSGFVL